MFYKIDKGFEIMREIKFRAWDEEECKMYNPKDVIVCFDYVCHDVYVKKDNYKELFDYKLMQYTGFNNIDNIEIYEEDIVKRPDGRIGVVKYGRYSTSNVNGIGNIGFYIDWNGDSLTRIDLGYWLEKIDVLGNIYENKDLLEEI